VGLGRAALPERRDGSARATPLLQKQGVGLTASGKSVANFLSKGDLCPDRVPRRRARPAEVARNWNFESISLQRRLMSERWALGDRVGHGHCDGLGSAIWRAAAPIHLHPDPHRVLLFKMTTGSAAPAVSAAGMLIARTDSSAACRD
jgi:hypothetical protein